MIEKLPFQLLNENNILLMQARIDVIQKPSLSDTWLHCAPILDRPPVSPSHVCR